MNDTISGLLGGALIVGLFVAYALQRRAARRPADVVMVQETLTQAESIASDEPVVQRSSPNWGAPIIFCALLVGADTHRSSWWGNLWQAIYFIILAVAAYSTFSPGELAAEQVRRPGTTRREHYLKLGVPYLVVPLIAWALAIPMGWKPAVLLPALPWILLLLFGLVAARR